MDRYIVYCSNLQYVYNTGEMALSIIAAQGVFSLKNLNMFINVYHTYAFCIYATKLRDKNVIGKLNRKSLYYIIETTRETIVATIDSDWLILRDLLQYLSKIVKFIFHFKIILIINKNCEKLFTFNIVYQFKKNKVLFWALRLLLYWIQIDRSL